MDYIEVIRHFIEPIVFEFDKVEIQELHANSKKEHIFLIRCTDQDVGRLIGRHGTTINALREVISIAAKNNNEYVRLKVASLSEPFENFESDEKKEEEEKKEDCE